MDFKIMVGLYNTFNFKGKSIGTFFSNSLLYLSNRIDLFSFLQVRIFCKFSVTKVYISHISL